MFLTILCIFLGSIWLTNGQDTTGLMVCLLPNQIMKTGMLDFYPGDINNMTGLTANDRGRLVFGQLRFVPDLDSNPSAKEVFIPDTASGTINKLQSYSKSLQSKPLDVIHRGISKVMTFRMDYNELTSVLSWTDSLLNNIMIQNTNDNRTYKVLVHKAVDYPGGIATDEEKGIIFWSEHRMYSVIIQKLEDPTGTPVTIVTSGVWIPDIALDTDAQRIYWIDNYRNSIESADYDGKQISLLYRSTDIMIHMNNLIIYRESVCFSEFNQNTVSCVNKRSRKTTLKSKITFEQPYGIHVYDTSVKQHMFNPCANNDCSQICMNTMTSRRCLCGQGFRLESDGKTCTAIHRYYDRGLIVTNGTMIIMLDILIITGREPDMIEMLTWGSQITFMTVDAENHVLYFADENNIITKFEFGNNDQTSVFQYSNNVSGLVYSWIDNNLYWSDSDTGTILMSTTKTNTIPRMIFDGLTNPTALALDAHNGILYWFSGTPGNYQIEYGYTNSSGKNMFLDDPRYLSNPFGLLFDSYDDSILWIDNGTIYAIYPGHPDVVNHGATMTNKTILLHKTFILTIVTENKLVVEDYYGITKLEIQLPINTVKTFAVYDSTTQVPEGPCETENGGCGQICLTFNSSYQCECEFGYTIDANQKSCSSTPFRDDFILTVDMTHGIIYQIDLDLTNLRASVIDIPGYIFPLAAIGNSTHVIWSEYSQGLILRTRLDGTNTVPLVYTPQHIVFSMEVDTSTGNLYFIAAAMEDFVPSFVGVMNPESDIFRYKTLVSDIVVGYGFALYAEYGEMYWTDKGSIAGQGLIERARMDGSARQILVSGLTSPVSVVVDKIDKRLFWCDRTDSTIYSTGINERGGRKYVVFHEDGAKMAHLTIFNSYIYFTATNIHGITKMTKTGKIVQTTNSTSVFGRIETVQVYSEEKVIAHAGCSRNNGRCSTYCLPTSKETHACGCPDGTDLLPDKRTCDGVIKCIEIVPNGKLNDECTAYVNNKCTYECDNNYIPNRKQPMMIICRQNGTWNNSLDNLCIQASKLSQSLTSGPVAGIVISVLILVALIVIAALYFVMKRRKQDEQFSHAKFENTPNIVINASNAEAYPTTQPVPPQSYLGEACATPEIGLSNPMYETKDPSNSENVMNEHTYTTIETTKKM